MIRSPIELDTDGAILLRQDGRASWASFHGLKGEKTLAEISRELDIQPSVVRQWRRRFEAGATAAVATNEDVVPVSALREAHQRIRELERLLGKKQMEIEILHLSGATGGTRGA